MLPSRTLMGRMFPSNNHEGIVQNVFNHQILTLIFILILNPTNAFSGRIRITEQSKRTFNMPEKLISSARAPENTSFGFFKKMDKRDRDFNAGNIKYEIRSRTNLEDVEETKYPLLHFSKNGYEVRKQDNLDEPIKWGRELSRQKRSVENVSHRPVFQYGKCSPEIYSCKSRCETTPRASCSCQWTCKIYGNCCYDVDKHCQVTSPEKAKLLQHFGPDDVECIDRNFLVSSCRNFDHATWEMFKEMAYGTNLGDNENVWWHLYARFDWSSGDVRERCEGASNNSDHFIRSVPVSASGLHFKNIFCAICNNITDIQPWIGFANCPDELGPSTLGESLSSEDNHLVSQILAHPQCQVAWLPSGTGEGPNTCFHDDELTQEVIDNLNRTTAGTKGGNGPGETSLVPTGSLGLVNNGENNVGFNIDWHNITQEPDMFFSNLTGLTDKCKMLTAYVEHPFGSGNVFKNQFCYLMEINSNLTNQMCEPSVPRLPQNALTYYKMEMLASQENSTGNSSWEVTQDIEETYMSQLLDEGSKTQCDLISHLLLDGQCYKKAFRVRLTSNFTFRENVFFKGDFEDQADKYTQHIVDTFTGSLSNTTVCVALTLQKDKVVGQKTKFGSVVEMECAEISGMDNNNNITKAETVDGNTIENDDINRYLSYITIGLMEIKDDRGLVKVPMEVNIFACVFPSANEKFVLGGYCSDVTNEWVVKRKAKAIIGEISLEGIITIICCLLSDIGLLVRLALQNVVPFYKSYPGKVQFSLCLSLLFAYTLFLIGGMVDEGTKACRVIAVMTHLAFLSALFWMNVTAFEIWRTFRHWKNQVVSRGNASLVLSTFYAVGLPILFVISALIIEELTPLSEFSPSYGVHFCWLNGKMAVAIFFVSPCSFICCMNAVFVSLTLRGLRRQRTSISEFKKSNAVTAVTDTTIVVKIILLVGITWLLGLLAAVVDNEILWIIFTIINASLGFLISSVLVLNKRVFYAVQKKCLCYTADSIAVVSTQVPRH